MFWMHIDGESSIDLTTLSFFQDLMQMFCDVGRILYIAVECLCNLLQCWHCKLAFVSCISDVGDCWCVTHCYCDKNICKISSSNLLSDCNFYIQCFCYLCMTHIFRWLVYVVENCCEVPSAGFQFLGENFENGFHLHCCKNSKIKFCL